jgi:hypothetical protein
VFLEAGGLNVLLGAGSALREGLRVASQVTHAAVVAAMHHIASLWLCLAQLKEAWAAAAAAAGAGVERVARGRHALWTTQPGGKGGGGVLPELGPQVCSLPTPWPRLYPPTPRTPLPGTPVATTITGNTFAASLRTDICPQRKGTSTSHARNPFNLNFLDSAQCLMVRRWR